MVAVLDILPSVEAQLQMEKRQIGWLLLLDWTWLVVWIIDVVSDNEFSLIDVQLNVVC